MLVIINREGYLNWFDLVCALMVICSSPLRTTLASIVVHVANRVVRVPMRLVKIRVSIEPDPDTQGYQKKKKVSDYQNVNCYGFF
jgi:hypothetical protein